MKDSEFSSLVRGAVFTLLVKVAGAALSFFVVMIIARNLGAAGAGVYFLAFSVLTFASLLVRFGLDSVIIKQVSIAYSKGDFGLVGKFYKSSFYCIGGAGIVVGLVFYFMSGIMAIKLFDLQGMQGLIKFVGLGVVGLSLCHMQCFFLLALGYVKTSVLFVSILIPLMTLSALVIISENNALTAELAFLVYCASCFCSFLASFIFVRNISKPSNSGIKCFGLKSIFNLSGSIYVSVMAEYLVLSSPVFLLGVYSSSEDVAVFSVCQRITTLIAFIFVSVNRVVAPRIAKLHESEFGDVENLVKKTIRLTLLLALLISSLMYFYPEAFLLLFGREYLDGVFVLKCYAILQIILVFYGVSRSLLQMTGHEGVCKRVDLFYLMMTVIICLMLVPVYSYDGAAVAILVSALICAIVMCFVVKDRLGFYLL